MSKAAIFRDPLRETAEYRLSEFFDAAQIPEDTVFTVYRFGSRQVRSYVEERGRAEPDSLWGRWYRGELQKVECPLRCEGAADCAVCSGSNEVDEVLGMSITDAAALMAAATVRARPLRVDVAENGGEPDFELWDTNDHPEERDEVLEVLYGDLPELTWALLVRSWEAQANFAAAYEATRKNSSASSRRAPKRRAKSTTKRKG